MMKCTHCNKELISYKKSAPIPNLDNETCYILCSCGNVMTAKFNDDNELIYVKATPEDDTPETHKMMQQASELFDYSSNGFYVHPHHNNSDTENVPEIEQQPQAKKLAQVAVRHQEGFFERLWHKFTSLLTR